MLIIVSQGSILNKTLRLQYISLLLLLLLRTSSLITRVRIDYHRISNTDSRIGFMIVSLKNWFAMVILLHL